MKRLLNYKNISGSILVLVLMTLPQGCTDDFKNINTDPYNISSKQLEIEYKDIRAAFIQAQQNIYAFSPVWKFQLQQNLNGDVYSGYMMPPTPFASNSNNMTYKLVDGWNGFPWSIAYSEVMGPLSQSIEKAKGEFPQFDAWAKILMVEAMHRVSDIYGPIVYSNFGKKGALYDSQEDAYKKFFADLESAVKVLNEYKQKDTSQPFLDFDYVYGGDYSKWIQFANSLRLRLAIRVSKVNPAYAKKQGEAAISAPGGLIEANNTNFLISSSTGASHPLNTINVAWNDIRMGAPMESILKGYDDPRISKYFRPMKDGKFQGIRQGIEIKAKKTYQGFSSLTSFGKVQLMTASEVHFLKAEAALRGWAGAGSAKDNYENGIKASFAQHSAGDPAKYIADAVKKPAEYIDPINPGNNVTGADLSTITIAWSDADPFERKLERIITQKWIAMYPDGQEAWSEVRRTGYPKLFKVKVNLSGGTIDTDKFIKRINFPAGPDGEKNTNPAGYASGVKALGGPDHGGTSLWWDVD